MAAHLVVGGAVDVCAVRLRGGLGPLQAEGADGALTFTAAKGAGGATIVSMSYVVGGYIRGGAEKLAPPVDAVLGEQLKRLQSHLQRPDK